MLSASSLLVWKRPCPCPQDRLWVWWGERGSSAGLPGPSGCGLCAVRPDLGLLCHESAESAPPSCRHPEPLGRASPASIEQPLGPQGWGSDLPRGAPACLPAVSRRSPAHSPGPCTAGARREGSLQPAERPWPHRLWQAFRKGWRASPFLLLPTRGHDGRGLRCRANIDIGLWAEKRRCPG